ncbi:MAG TPA: FHA domain-containing protein [Burkholderiales bacterium]|nr:FHA domain-containing protein [Burkholderiales bacterium]
MTKRIRGTRGRRTAVLFARVSANQRPQVEPMGPRLRCVEALAQAAELSGGRVLRRQGDAIMALFATADAAAAAATRMHAYVETGGEQAGELKVRIGLQAGPVTQDGRDVLGDTVSLALEFSRLAANGQIVTSAETAASLNPGVQAAVRPLAAGNAGSGLKLREVAWRDASSKILGAQKDAAARRPIAIRLAYRDKVLVRRREWDVVTIGRDAELDFVIDQQTVSRRHCDVIRREGRFLLRDHSTNGTFVMIEGEGELHVHVGELVLRKNGWIAPGLSGDVTEDVVRYWCE